jgi:hypothetical protein
MMSIKKWGVLFAVIAANFWVMSLTFAQADTPLGEDAGYHTGIPTDAVLIGDMVFPAGTDMLRGTYNTNTWPGGIVPYAFDAAVTETNRNRAIAAMAEWEAVAGVDFIPRTTETAYINLINSTGNWSYVGRTGGKQDIGMYNWSYKFIIAHELAHALGIWHEQSRPDRDTYVTINIGNISTGNAHNFNITGTAHGAYDFSSIMHYDDYAFSSNGQPTIVAKPGYEYGQALMGNRSNLSNGDKGVMASLYPNGDTADTARLINHLYASYAISLNSTTYNEGNEPTPTPCLSGATITDTIWFKIAANPVVQVLDLSAGGYDTVLAIYRGAPDNLTLQACSNTSGVGNPEAFDFPLLTNTDYYIQVGGINGSAGMLAFNATFKRTMVVNGGFEGDLSSWMLKSTTLDDKIKTIGTNGVDKSAGWIQFKGSSAENTSVKQTRLYSELSSAGWYFLAGNVYAFGADIVSPSANNRVILKVTFRYGDGKPTVQKIVYSGTYRTWTTVSAQIILTRADVADVTFVVNNKSTSGTSRVDNVYLYLVSFGEQGGGGHGQGSPLAFPTAP